VNRTVSFENELVPLNDRISGWCSSNRFRPSQSYDVSKPNLCICAMDVSNDKLHVNTVRDFEVGVTTNPVSYMVASSTGCIELLLDRSLGDVASFKQ